MSTIILCFICAALGGSLGAIVMAIVTAGARADQDEGAL